MVYARRAMPALLAAILVALLFAAPVRAAVYDPLLKWRTISTAHFFINYPEELAEQALTLAGRAEGIYDATAKSMGFEPASPVEVVLVDDTDSANGWATVLPFNVMTLYAVQPQSSSSIADYNDWLTLLFSHELRHIFTLGARRGYAKGMAQIFGEAPLPPFSMSALGVLSWFFASPPNIFLPDWLHEGEAVNAESEIDGAGRNNSTYYEMIYRSAVADGNIPPIDRIIGFYPEFPSFSAPYVFGARLMESVSRRYGEAAAGKLFYGHGGRVPYAIDDPPKRTTGLTYTGLYDEMAAGLRAEYAPKIEKLRAEGLTPFKELTNGGYEAHSPVWLDQERLVYTRRTPTESNRLILFNTSTGEEKFLTFRPGFTDTPALLPDGSILFTRLEIERPWAGGLDYGDLYRLSPDGSETRITRGARILAVTASADGGLLAGVFADKGKTRLSTFAIEGEKCIEKILLAETGVRYDSPSLRPDGKSLSFTRKLPGEKERLAELELSSGRILLLTPPDCRALSPLSASGERPRTIYSSDCGGVFNLWESSPAQRRTNFLGGAFEPALSPDGSKIAFSSFSSRGYNLALLEVHDLKSAVSSNFPSEELKPYEKPAPMLPQGARDEPYSALRKLPPSFWLPDAVADNTGGALGAFTAGQDSLGEHVWAAGAYWSGGMRRPYARLLYVNDAWYPTLTLDAAKLPWLYSGLLPTPAKDYDYWEEQRTLSLGAMVDLSSALRGITAGGGFALEEVYHLRRVEEDLDGNAALASLPFEGRQNYLWLTALYDSTPPHSTYFTLGPSAGRRAEATFRFRSEATGSERTAREWLLTDREYLGLPLGTALNLSGTAGLGSGEATVQSLFQIGGGSLEFPLRGYPGRVDCGDKAFAGTGEFLFPLYKLYRGRGDLPFFLDRLYGALFYDAGRVMKGGDGEWRTSAGAEARIETVLAYKVPITFAVGYAHGFDEDGTEGGFFRLLASY